MVPGGIPKFTETQRFSEERGIVLDTYTPRPTRTLQAYTDYWFQQQKVKDGLKKQVRILVKIRDYKSEETLKKAEDKVFASGHPRSLSYQSRLNQNSKLQAKSFIIRKL